MHRKFAWSTLVALCSLVACEGEPAPGRTIQGGGVIAPGIEVRFDSPESELKEIRFVKTDTGYRAENGPNAIFWRPEDVAKDRYTLSVAVQHLDSHLHPHGAGLIFGGSALAAAGQKYTYFLIRGDGKFLIKSRAGESTQDVSPWSSHDAIVAQDSAGVVKNRIAVAVGVSETRFLANGIEVFRVANSKIHTDGVFGFRMVHDLAVHFVGLTCKAAD